MYLPIGRLATRAAAALPALLTLAALAGVGYVGYRNDWTLPSLAQLRGESEAPDREAARDTTRVVAGSPGGGPSRVEFDSAESVRKAGLRWEPARAQALGQYVTANGMVDYDPGSYARLTSRASGFVWHVYHEIGDPVKKGDVLALIDAAEVGKAKSDFLQDLGQVRTRSTTLDRLKSLGQQGAASDRTLREAEAALREARVRLFNDHQALLNLGLPLRLKDVEDLPEDQWVRHLRLLGLPDAVARDL